MRRALIDEANRVAGGSNDRRLLAQTLALTT